MPTCLHWIIRAPRFGECPVIPRSAGASSLLYESVAEAENPVVLYGIIFATGGWIAYQLSTRVLDRVE